jgi:hypothetical protein
MSYRRRISPRGALADLWQQWRQPTPYRWPALGISMAITLTMLTVLIPDSQRVPPARPEVSFITTFAPDRTDAEVIASNLAHQKRKDALEAAAAERAERRKQAARALARASGMDPDELERQFVERYGPVSSPSAP